MAYKFLWWSGMVDVPGVQRVRRLCRLPASAATITGWVVAARNETVYGVCIGAIIPRAGNRANSARSLVPVNLGWLTWSGLPSGRRTGILGILLRAGLHWENMYMYIFGGRWGKDVNIYLFWILKSVFSKLSSWIKGWLESWLTI